MAKFLKSIGLAALLAMAGPALAQDADTPAENGPGTTYIDEVFSDWSRECMRLPEGAEGPDPCRMVQILVDADKNPVGKIAVGRQPEGSGAAASSEVALPIGLQILLTQGLTVGVDDGLTKQYDFYMCRHDGCTARLLFTANDVAAFKAGDVMKLSLVSFLPPEGQATRLVIPVSLNGFTKAYDSLARTETPAQ